MNIGFLRELLFWGTILDHDSVDGYSLIKDDFCIINCIYGRIYHLKCACHILHWSGYMLSLQSYVARFCQSVKMIFPDVQNMSQDVTVVIHNNLHWTFQCCHFMASQITGNLTVSPSACSGWHQGKHQSSPLLALVRRIYNLNQYWPSSMISYGDNNPNHETWWKQFNGIIEFFLITLKLHWFCLKPNRSKVHARRCC